VKGDRERLLGPVFLTSSALAPRAKECNFGSHSSPSTRDRLGCGGRVFLTLFGLAFS
jgi:hypothetical protein